MTGAAWRTLTLAMALTLVIAGAAAAAEGGGGTSTENGDAMTYVTIGVAVVIGGLLIWDAIADRGEETLEPTPVDDEVISGTVDTGIDWDSTFPEDSASTTIAVALVPGDMELSVAIMDALSAAAPEGVSVVGDVLDLGSGDPVALASMAGDFFGADLLFHGTPPAGEGEEGLLMVIASSQEVLWSGELYGPVDADEVAGRILASGAL